MPSAAGQRLSIGSERLDAAPAVSGRGWRRTTASELLMNLTMRDIRSQYKRTVLGRLWSFINPLATIAIFSLVFGVVFVAQPPPGGSSGLHSYPLWLTAGLIPWTFISGSITTGMMALTANSGLLGKVYFPRHVLVVSTVLSLASTFLLELVVVLTIMVIFGGPKVLIFIPGLILLVALTAVFTTGIALMLSISLVYFRDTQHLVGIFTQIWFYASAIIYSYEQVAPKLQDAGNHLMVFGHPFPFAFLFRLNPVYRFAECYRAMLYHFQLPSWPDLVGSVCWAALALGVGILVFRKYSGRVVEEL